MRASELSYLVMDDLGFYTAMYLSFFLLYLVLYRKIVWGLFDPMFYSMINLVGGAFCVWLLYYQNSLKPEFGWSFVYTELGLFGGLMLAQFIPAFNWGSTEKHSQFNELDNPNISEFDVFTFVCGAAYIALEVVSVLTIGIVLLNSSETHVTAFSEHGILRALVSSYRTIMIALLFYKKVVYRQDWNLFDIFCICMLLFGVLTSGSKGAILNFVFLYFTVSYPMIYHGLRKKIRVSLPLMIMLGSFPVMVMMIRVGTDSSSALQQVYVRLLAAGDVFLLGYYDNVMESITETSFVRYAFYPGWGSVLKNLGFQVKAPRLIGSDIFEFYTTNLSGGGPNARHNYLGYHFFGFYWSILYSFIIGFFVGAVRTIFKNLHPYKMSYFGYLFWVTFAFIVPSIIDDLNIFANSIFWCLLFLCTSYVATKFIYLLMKAVVYKPVQEEMA